MKQEEKIEILDLSSQNSKIEILDFADNDNPLETRKENRIMLVIALIVLVTLTLIPVVSNYFSNNNSPVISNSTSDIESKDTIDGYLEIGNSEGSITAKKVQFYNFQKRTGNKITFNYLPQNTINDVQSLNLYIELYNNKKVVIYRKKFSVSSLERKVLGIYTISLNENLYGESAYAKINILNENDFNTMKETLICTSNSSVDNYEVINKISYNFSTNGLVNYEVDRVVNGVEGEEINNYFESEYNSLAKYKITDLVSKNDSISYTINLLDTKLGDYKALYPLGSANREIKLDNEIKGWRCE